MTGRQPACTAAEAGAGGGGRLGRDLDPAGRPVGRWADLRKRSYRPWCCAVGAAEIWLGGPSFAVLVVLLTGVMVWELATMTGARTTQNTPLGAGGPCRPCALAMTLVLCQTGSRPPFCWSRRWPSR